MTKNKIYNSTDYRSLTPAERTVFKGVIETLTERGLLDEGDLPVIAAYARNVVLARVAARDVEKHGAVIEFEDRGYKKYKANPAIAIMNQAQTAYLATALKLGLTPTGRKRLKGEGVAPKSALDQFNEEFDG